MTLILPQVSKAAAAHLAIEDPSLLQFSVSSSSYYSDEKIPSTTDTLGDMLTYARNTEPVLQFIRIPIPIKQFETCTQHEDLTWFDQEAFATVKIDALFPRGTTLGDVITEVAPKMKPLANGSRTYRVVSCGVQFETKSNLDLLSYLRYCHLRVEEIPLEEVALKPDQAVVRVSHFHKDFFDNHGIPFYFVVTDGERVADLLKRLQAFMKVSDADFEKWKLHLVYLHRPTLLDPESTINIRDLRYYGSLAFQHPNKNAKKTKTLWAEKAVKIHN